MEIATENRVKRRMVACAAGLLLAIGGAACGGSDDSADAGAEGEATTGSTAERLDDGTPRGAIRARYAEFTEAMYAEDATALCSMLSRSVKRSIGDGDNCPATFRKYLSRTELSSNRPWIVRLELDGPRATAIVKTKNSDRYPVPFAKEGDEWKINGGF